MVVYGVQHTRHIYKKKIKKYIWKYFNYFILYVIYILIIYKIKL